MKSGIVNTHFSLWIKKDTDEDSKKLFRICPFTNSRNIALYRRLINNMTVGGIVGALILHPLSMIAHNIFHLNDRSLWDILVLTFSFEHLPMSAYFVIIGMAFGLVNGIWLHITSKLYQEIHMMAITDDLTSLYNRRFFQNRLAHEVNRAHRYDHPLSLLIIDVDFFKQYNDAHGHPAGDEILQYIGHLFRKLIRKSDIAARYGGEEFVILMPETDSRRAKELALRICAAVSCHPFNHRQTQPGGKITVSIGLAELPSDAQTSEELIRRADQALYKAKKNGKNRVDCAI